MDQDNHSRRSWSEAQVLKEELFRRASVGELSGDEADAEAERLGLGKLSQAPDPDELDPEAEKHWSLVMAVAWIAYRNANAVRDAWDLYCAECWYWVKRRRRNGPDGPIHYGWQLEQKTKPTLARLALGSAFDRVARESNPLVMFVSEAENALFVALREGALKASGLDLKTGRRVLIPALDWHELKRHDFPRDADEFRFSLLGGGYGDILVASELVRRFWLPPRVDLLVMPPLMTPQGDGFMPFYCAAQWIATEGGRIAFDPEDTTFWIPAYTQLLAAISSDKVRTVGTRDGTREPVPGHHFADCDIEYPFCEPTADLFWSDALHLRSQPYLDQESWRGGFDDALLNGFEPRWSRLMVAKEDVLSRWPFPLPGEPDAGLHTGLPGRPQKSAQLIVGEFRRRVSIGTTCNTLANEAKALVDWLAVEHSDQPTPTVRTVENRIRAEFREVKRPTK